MPSFPIPITVNDIFGQCLLGLPVPYTESTEKIYYKYFYKTSYELGQPWQGEESAFEINYLYDFTLLEPKEYNAFLRVNAKDWQEVNDWVFRKLLFESDKLRNTQLFDFLDYHLNAFVERYGDTKDFLRHTQVLIEPVNISPKITDEALRQSILAKFEPRKRYVLDWIEERDKQAPVKSESKKIVWLGSAAEFGWVFGQMERTGYIQFPTNFRREESPTEFARQLLKYFEVYSEEGPVKVAYLANTLIEDKNKCSRAFKRGVNPPPNKDTSTKS